MLPVMQDRQTRLIGGIGHFAGHTGDGFVLVVFPQQGIRSVRSLARCFRWGWFLKRGARNPQERLALHSGG